MAWRRRDDSARTRRKILISTQAWVRDEDGALCRPGGIVEAPPIDPAEIQAKIDAQAAVVRYLKEEQGLGNSDPEVKAAVTELLRLKALLEE